MQDSFHDSTNWAVKPSLKYDMFCFMNILTGDTFYTHYYTEDYERFKDKVTPGAKEALYNLKRIIKDEGGLIVPAWLSLYYSASEAETPEEMLAVTDNFDNIKTAFSKTVYHEEEAWKRFESLKPYLKTALQFLIDIRFPQYWEENIKPMLLEKAEEQKKNLNNYNVVKDVERHLGFPLEDNTITLYVLYYSKPHGVKITGTRFLSFGDYPFKVSLRTAVHEMMHPPYDKKDSMLFKKLEVFKQDEFLMDKVLNHDPAFGYNSFEGVIEEDCVQALDQLINTGYEAHVEPRFRWKYSDGGMHVFAVALYSLMKKENFRGGKENFTQFLTRLIDGGKLAPGKIKPLYNEFYKDYIYEEK